MEKVVFSLLFVYLCLYKITQKVVDGFEPNC